MDHELKAKWTAALRSGEYKQTKRQLEYKGAYCCLGVLCRIQGRACDYLTSIDPHLPDRVQYDLWNLNDTQGLPFTEIADYIDANL